MMIFIEPLSGSAVVWIAGGYFLPEKFGMVGHCQVHQLVDDHVINHFQRGHGQAPAEIEVFFAAAGTPAPPGAGYGYSGISLPGLDGI